MWEGKVKAEPEDLPQILFYHSGFRAKGMKCNRLALIFLLLFPKAVKLNFFK